MRGVLLFLECLFVFLLIPLFGMELWEAKANSLVQKGDALLMSDPKEAVLLYQKADTVCFGGSTLASNRLRVCKSYGIELDGALGEESTRSVFRDRNGNFENEATFEREYPGGRRCFSDRWSDKGCADLTMEEATYDLPDEVIDKFKERHPASEYLYSYNEWNEPYRDRIANLTLAMKAFSFTRSLEKMPRLEDDCERKLWEDSSELPKVRRVLIARIRALAEDGCVWAQKEYALCYQTGDCVQQSSSEALKWYLEAAKQGDATAAVIVACWYRDGKGVEKNESEMVSWLKEASKQGDADAEFLLAQCYEAGRGVSKDVKVALELYRSAATRGHVKACSLLGIRFINSTDEEEKVQAFNWLEFASAGGDIEATTHVGICYYEGKGVKKDVDKAFSLFAKAAEAGNAEAQFRLGFCYYVGKGTKKDVDKAFSLFQRAAYAGNIAAQSWLGECYCEGFGVEVNDKEGFSWIEKAAKGGYARASRMLGDFYRTGRGGVKKDLTLALKWYKTAAERDDVLATTIMACTGISLYLAETVVEKDEYEAVKWLQASIENSTDDKLRGMCQYLLGDLYFDGKGVPQDKEKAFMLFLSAANNGVVEAQYKVGVCYEIGSGVPKNVYTSFSWYKKAADNGNVISMYFVGIAYASGSGVEKDEREAVKWFKTAMDADGADPKTKSIRGGCQVALGRMYLGGRGVNKDEKKAFSLFLSAANDGLAKAQLCVGNCYFEGVGVSKNAYTAFNWYKKAAEQNDAQGQSYVAACYLFGKGVTRDVNEGYKWAKESADQGFFAGQFYLGMCYENGYGKEGNVPNRPDKAKALAWYRKAAAQGDEGAKEKVRSLSSRSYN